MVYIIRFEQFGKPGQINADLQRQAIESLLTSSRPPVECCVRPDFMRLVPPLHCADDEVKLITKLIRVILIQYFICLINRDILCNKRCVVCNSD